MSARAVSFLLLGVVGVLAVLALLLGFRQGQWLIAGPLLVAALSLGLVAATTMRAPRGG